MPAGNYFPLVLLPRYTRLSFKRMAPAGLQWLGGSTCEESMQGENHRSADQGAGVGRRYSVGKGQGKQNPGIHAMALVNSIPLGEASAEAVDLAIVLDRLDRLVRDRETEERRRDYRVRIRVRAAVFYFVRDGFECGFVVPTRNVSRSGIAFLHQEELPLGTPCKVRLELVKGGRLDVRGQVARCRKVCGRTHEVGLAFHEPIDVSRLQTHTL
jgi:hypothetical protein